MKKSIMVMFAVVLFLASCGKNKSLPKENIMYDDGEVVSAVSVPKGGDDFYIGEAIRLTKESGKLAKSDEFVAMYTSDDEVAEQIKSIADTDFENPKSVKYLYFNKDKIIEYLEAAAGENEQAIDFELVLELNRFSINNIVSLINARYGASMIAATTVLTNGCGYVKPEDFEKDFAVYLEYDGEFSSVVSFKEFGENVISANMTFVKNGEEQIDMLMEEVFDSLGEESITVQEVTREK